MSDMWPHLLQNLDPDLVRCIALDRVLLARDGTKMQIRFTADRLIQAKEFKLLQKRMREGFPSAQVSVRISYPGLKEQVLEDVQQYAKFVAGLASDQRPGAMPYLFWSDAKWRLSKDKQRLHVDVLDQMGANSLSAQGVDQLIVQLMRELFSIHCRVIVDVVGTEEMAVSRIAEKREQEEKLLQEAQAASMAAKKAKEQEPLPEKVIMGKLFDQSEIPCGELTEDAGKVVLMGEVGGFELRDLKNGASKLISFSLTDVTGACPVKAFLGSKKDSAETVARIAESCQAGLKDGKWVKVRGDYQYDSFKREMVLMARDILRAEKPTRMDTADQKRVELHLHTNMSAMDGMASPTDLINMAAKWGHPAIAITDHGVVQAFPEAFGAAKRAGIKLIPGCEAYLIDDTVALVKGAGDRALTDARYVVFDVETTGLNGNTDKIIELGAVRMENGVEVAEFSRLINPMRPISEKITEITGITDGMVRDCPTIAQVITEFADFIKDCVLVAHNADFDTAFLRRALEDAGLKLAQPVLDTLAFSRAALPELKSHKLGSVCKRFGINLKNAHRAVHDARATGLCLMEMLRLAEEKCGAQRGQAPQETQAEGEELVFSEGADDDWLSLDNTRRDAPRPAAEPVPMRLSDLNNLYDGTAQGSAYHMILLATSQEGMTNLYRLISEAHLSHFKRTPRMPRSLVNKYRKGLLVGSACEAGELYRAVLDGKADGELMAIARFYDYLEIQPRGNNEFLVRSGKVPSEDAILDINRKIVWLADRLNIPVVATGDVHFKEPHDAMYRAILMAAKGFEDADQQAPLYFKTTDEMLREFAYLGEEDARRVVIEAPREIADRVGKVRIFKEHPEGKETFQPFWADAEADIRNLSETKSAAVYGDPVPEIVRARLDKELGAIIGYGFSTLYDIAVKLVQKSMSDGYIVGSRGSVGSSYVAWATGITEVNALPPHYVCPKCKHSEFDVPHEYTCGLDLPDKNCPECGAVMNRDGFNIPFEVFLGFKGDKVPDIDLNFSGEYQPTAHNYVKELFGAENVFRAGTIGTVAEKTAYGYVLKYLEERGMNATNAEKERLARGCTGVKRTTGQHPAGMVVLPLGNEIYEFTPIQRPADDLTSETITTHFDFNSMHDVLVKLDILGHDDPTMLRKLQDLTGIAPQKVPLHDAEVFKNILSLFQSPAALGVTPEQIGVPTGTLGVPEFGTRFVRQMLVETKPSSMEELIRISGLSHGTDVWVGNTQDIVKAGIAPLRQCICTRDDIMNQLIDLGVASKMAFDIMESVRKGKGLKPEMEQAMVDAETPAWFIESCKKIKYMFPKAHAVAYVTMALRIAYFKIYYPQAYYVCYLKRNAGAFDGSRMIAGARVLRGRLDELFEMDKSQKTAKDDDEATLLEILVEMNERGITLLPVSLYESDAVDFLRVGEDKILPPLSSLPGLGENAARNLQQAREAGEFISQEDMVRRKVAKSVVEILKANGCLSGLPETSQVSLFDF